MKESKFVIMRAAVIENTDPDDFNEIKQVRKRHESRQYVEKPLDKTVKHTSGIKRLYRLAGRLLENAGL